MDAVVAAAVAVVGGASGAVVVGGASGAVRL